MDYIIVLFKDGSYIQYPESNFKYFSRLTFEEGARYFRVAPGTTIVDLFLWTANNFYSKQFVEVDPWA